MRAFALSLLALAGCADAADAPVASSGASAGATSLAPAGFEFVNTNEACADVLDVPPGAARLEVDLGVALSIGTVDYALTDPDGGEQWAGTTDTPDTLMTWRTEAPAAGAWTMTLTPSSATGAAQVSGRTE